MDQRACGRPTLTWARPRHSGRMPHVSRADPSGLPAIVTRGQALTAGMTDGEIRSRIERGRWHILASGTYLRTDIHGDDERDNEYARAETLHVLESLAAARHFAGGVVAFGSAALGHGMQLASGVPRHRELVVPPGRWNGIRAGSRVRIANLDPADVLPVAGTLMTTPARTWVDVARTSDLADALSAGDSVLRNTSVTLDELRAALERHPAKRGLRKVEQALPLLNPLRENPLESMSFAFFAATGLPLPECQVEIWDDESFVGRVDFLWREYAVIGEADGRGKYHDPNVLYAEKRREGRLRALGFIVVRWGWELGEALRRRLTGLLLP